MSLTLPSHFGSHSLPSQNGVRARSEKSEGDVRENRLPSRVLSPLYIGIRASSCEKVRDIFEYVIFFTSYTSKSGISLSRFVQRLQTMSPKASDCESVGFGLLVRRDGQNNNILYGELCSV